MGINDAQGQMVHGLPVAITTGPYIALTALCCFPRSELRWPILDAFSFDATTFSVAIAVIYLTLHGLMCLHISHRPAARDAAALFTQMKQISMRDLSPSVTISLYLFFPVYREIFSMSYRPCRFIVSSSFI